MVKRTKKTFVLQVPVRVQRGAHRGCAQPVHAGAGVGGVGGGGAASVLAAPARAGVPLRVLFGAGAVPVSLPAQLRPAGQQGVLPAAALARGLPAARRLQGVLRGARAPLRPARLRAHAEPGQRGRPAPLQGQVALVGRRRTARATPPHLQAPRRLKAPKSNSSPTISVCLRV